MATVYPAANLRVEAASPAHLWARASTWGLLLLFIYFALDGVSPFLNVPTATRVVATTSAGGAEVERLGKLLVCLACMLFVLRAHQSVFRMSMQNRLITAFPILALLLSPVSQMPSRTISSGMLLFAAILLLYYLMCRYTFDQVLELLLVLGTVTIFSSIVFALVLPQYGLDLMGGHDTAWKGIFSAKNYLGTMALFFLTAAIACRPRTSFIRSMRLAQMVFCLTALVFSRAATAYMLAAVYFAYLLVIKTLHHFRKRDYLVVSIALLAVFVVAIATVVVAPDFLIGILGKDATLTGRTQIWAAVLDSIARRPLLGYGYQAFWLGLEGESYRVILAVSWVLAQAQNGFLDVLLETGLGGLAIVLLIFGFALRDGVSCLLRSHDALQLRAVEWYLAIVLLTLLYNLDESFLFEPKHLASMIFLLACIGLKKEWLHMRT